MEMPGPLRGSRCGKNSSTSAKFGEAERSGLPPQRNLLGPVPVDGYPDPMDVLAAPGAGLP